MAAASISNEDGYILLDELEYDDNYYLYISPTKEVATLDHYFQSARSNFCNGRSEYRGTFFQSCYARNKGYPQPISILEDKYEVEIESISIGCNMDVPTDYLNRRDEGGAVEIDYEKGAVEYVQVGYFSSVEIDAGKAVDQYNIDLTNYDIGSDEVYLDVKIISNQLYFPIKILAKIEKSGLEEKEYPVLTNGVFISDDNSVNMDVNEHILLDTSSQENNYIKLTISAELMEKYLDENTITDYTMEDIFPAYESFLDKGNYYLLMINLSKKEGDEYVPFNASSNPSSEITNNNKCLDGTGAYRLSGLVSTYESTTDSGTSEESDENIFSCGTISQNRGGGGGMFSIMVGLSLIFHLGSDFEKSSIY